MRYQLRRRTFDCEMRAEQEVHHWKRASPPYKGSFLDLAGAAFPADEQSSLKQAFSFRKELLPWQAAVGMSNNMNRNHSLSVMHQDHRLQGSICGWKIQRWKQLSNWNMPESKLATSRYGLSTTKQPMITEFNHISQRSQSLLKAFERALSHGNVTGLQASSNWMPSTSQKQAENIHKPTMSRRFTPTRTSIHGTSAVSVLQILMGNPVGNVYHNSLRFWTSFNH